MDSLIMAVRCALLVVATGTFAALWSGDQPDQIAAVDRPTKVMVVRHDSGTDRQSIQCDRSSRIAIADSSHVGVAISNSSEMSSPLPFGIPAGTYLVADQYGRTSVRVISRLEGSLGQSQNSSIRNHYSIESGKNRWHYIRLEERVDDRTTASALTQAVVR